MATKNIYNKYYAIPFVLVVRQNTIIMNELYIVYTTGYLREHFTVQWTLVYRSIIIDFTHSLSLKT